MEINTKICESSLIREGIAEGIAMLRGELVDLNDGNRHYVERSQKLLAELEKREEPVRYLKILLKNAIDEFNEEDKRLLNRSYTN